MNNMKKILFLTLLFCFISVVGFAKGKELNKDYSNVLKMNLYMLENANEVFEEKYKYVAFLKKLKTKDEEKKIVELGKKYGYEYIKLPFYDMKDMEGNLAKLLPYDENRAYFFYNKKMINEDIKKNQEKIKQYNLKRDIEKEKQIRIDMMAEYKEMPKEYEFAYSFTSEIFVFPFRNIEKAFSTGDEAVAIYSQNGANFNLGDTLRKGLEFGYGRPEILSSSGSGLLYPLIRFKRIAK